MQWSRFSHAGYLIYTEYLVNSKSMMNIVTVSWIRPLDVKKNEREMTASKRVSISCQESTHKKRSSILSVLGSPFPCSCLRVIVKINSLWWNVTRIYLSACDCGERVPAMSNQRDNYEILTHTHGSQMSSLSFPPASSEGRMLPCDVCCQVWRGAVSGFVNK